MDEINLPVVCSLNGPEFQQRRNNVLLRVSKAIVETKELEDGYAYRFPSEAIWIGELANLITLERQCCSFLRFNLRLDPGAGPIWLELSGPAGTKDFLNSIFSSAILIEQDSVRPENA
jgi:hypothetical protein